MRIKHALQVSGAILAVLALCVLLAPPVQAAARIARGGLPVLVTAGAATSVDANVYLTAQMLQPMFQSDINQAIPQMVGKALASMVSQLPSQDQGWAQQMAGALLQPSATLVSLTPEADGLLSTIRVSLYPGDPKAISTSVLIGFKVSNASTIQVTALPSANGSPSLLSGPLTTFKVPIGSLNSIAATPQCGDADLSINLQFPMTLGNSGQTSATTSSGTGTATTTTLAYTRPADPALNAYIELPATSLAQLGSSLGSIQVSSSITAQNIRVSVEGSDLMTTADIYWHGLNVGTAVSTMLPGAASGNLVVQVQKTALQILGGLISFPLNSYNQQIQQDLNTALNGALSGTFYVEQAAIGPNEHLTCAAGDSLVLAGALTLG